MPALWLVQQHRLRQKRQMTAPILIAGPTASGKSALALALAELTNGVIINADALQVYGLWRVLTARPSAQEEEEAPHRLYGHIHPTTSYSVGEWLRDLDTTLIEARKQNLRPIIIGGTGLYFAALTEGLAEIPPIPQDIRAKSNEMRAKGAAAFAELEQTDPKTWARIDTNNPARLQRAWEVLTATGRPLSDWQDDTPPPRFPLQNTIPICLDADTDWLNERIERRLDIMVEGGALDECRAWIEAGHNMNLPSAKALGAPELISYLKGEITLETALTDAKTATRRFAKRQRTWFRSRMSDWHHIPLGPPDSVAPFERAKELITQKVY